MVSRNLMGCWAFLDLCLLVSGALSVAFSVLWRQPDVLVNMVVSETNLMGGMALGILLLITFLVSIGAVVQRNHVTFGFVILNWLLIVDSLAIVVIGTFVWFFTLQERANFRELWLKAQPQERAALQDKFSCCGYEFANESAEISQFCSSPEFINALDPNKTSNFCIEPLTGAADTILNNIFTVVYGFMAVVICLFLASMCVIKKRQEDERFQKIDAKRGGRGFV